MNTQHNLDMLNAIQAHVNQRPGLEFCNYGDVSAYRSDYRKILQAKHDFERMARFCQLYSVEISDGLSAYSGRLKVIDNGDRAYEVEYCTGQYWPTEYRDAACAVLAMAIWSYYRACGYDTAYKIRKQASCEFGRGIALRWFN